jgi:aryl-phospho-beta-D-glucosidase BglC (GH1 family)
VIKEAGFNSVRIPIRWSAHASTAAPYDIETDFFRRVDWAIGSGAVEEFGRRDQRASLRRDE